MESAPAALTLAQLNRRIASALAVAPGLNDVWVMAETSDVRTSGGHCYMELVQKDDRGTQVAKARAVMWASTFARLGQAFAEATGTRFASDMKVMVRVNVNFHAVYGMSLVINDIDLAYSAGDLVRRRNEIVARLRREGVLELNRTLEWPVPAQRVAVVSASGAAGYGDFVKHLFGSGLRLRFECELFAAVMQGERAAASIIDALERIGERADEFDCVVVIRGGGAVSDLACFDDYALANNIAQFPLPVIVGIGHERDVTVLDYVAHARVKTPTAAAELLLQRQAAEYERLVNLGRAIHTATTERVAGQHRQLEYYRGQLPALARAATVKARAYLDRYSAATFRDLAANRLDRQRQRLAACAELLEALAPEATLRRGYSITRIDGHAVTDAAALNPGDVITTVFASGTTQSTVNSHHT